MQNNNVHPLLYDSCHPIHAVLMTRSLCPLQVSVRPAEMEGGCAWIVQETPAASSPRSVSTCCPSVRVRHSVSVTLCPLHCVHHSVSVCPCPSLCVHLSVSVTLCCSCLEVLHIHASLLPYLFSLSFPSFFHTFFISLFTSFSLSFLYLSPLFSITFPFLHPLFSSTHPSFSLPFPFLFPSISHFSFFSFPNIQVWVTFLGTNFVLLWAHS